MGLHGVAAPLSRERPDGIVTRIRRRWKSPKSVVIRLASSFDGAQHPLMLNKERAIERIVATFRLLKSSRISVPKGNQGHHFIFRYIEHCNEVLYPRLTLLVPIINGVGLIQKKTTCQTEENYGGPEERRTSASTGSVERVLGASIETAIKIAVE